MGRIGPYIFIADIVLTAAALISCLSTEDEDLRVMPRVLWVLLILFFPFVGALAWFFAGRERVAAAPRFPDDPRPGRSVAPDDDPEFLKRLDRERADLAAAQQQEEEREMLRKWEEDLKRREDELRKKDQPDD